MAKTYVKVPFELERAKLINEGLRDGYIETRVGFRVRIVCWDLNRENHPILGLVSTPLEERIVAYDNFGFAYDNRTVSSDDLVLCVPEYR